MSSAGAPRRLNLKRDERLEIEWADGQKSSYPISTLRMFCSCAQCRSIRDRQESRKGSSLPLLPGNFARPITVVHAELVGNYALRIEWSDGHNSGIYTFDYLRSLARPGEQ